MVAGGYGESVSAIADPAPSRTFHPGWLSHLTALATLLLSAWELSAPGARLLMSLFLGVVWSGVACYWLLGLPATVIWERRLPDRHSWPQWLVIPVTVAATAALWQTGAALQARFLLSQPAMSEMATSILASPEGREISDRRVGLYWAKDIERVRGAVRFHVAASGFGNSTGFAYSPEREPPNLGEDTYEHLQGPWWLWHESW
jgi:hypothetical protein